MTDNLKPQDLAEANSILQRASQIAADRDVNGLLWIDRLISYGITASVTAAGTEKTVEMLRKVADGIENGRLCFTTANSGQKH